MRRPRRSVLLDPQQDLGLFRPGPRHDTNVVRHASVGQVEQAVEAGHQRLLTEVADLWPGVSQLSVNSVQSSARWSISPSSHVIMSRVGAASAGVGADAKEMGST